MKKCMECGVDGAGAGRRVGRRYAEGLPGA